ELRLPVAEQRGQSPVEFQMRLRLFEQPRLLIRDCEFVTKSPSPGDQYLAVFVRKAAVNSQASIHNVFSLFHVRQGAPNAATSLAIRRHRLGNAVDISFARAENE